MLRTSGVAARLLGLLLVVAVSAQGAGALAGWGQPAGETCCCHARGAHQCSCPVCAHAREAASSRPLLQPCSGGGAAVRPAQAKAIFLTRLSEEPAPLPAWPLPLHAPLRLHAPPPDEVPTPPPLA